MRRTAMHRSDSPRVPRRAVTDRTAYRAVPVHRDSFDQLEETDAQTGIAPGDEGSGMPALASEPSGWRPEELAAEPPQIERLEDPGGDWFDQLESGTTDTGQLASDGADWRTDDQKAEGIPK